MAQTEAPAVVATTVATTVAATAVRARPTREEREFLAATAQLTADYAGTIDDDRLEAWPDYFAPECLYRIETREGRASGWPIGLMHCEGLAMLRDRVLAIRHGNVFDPHTYRHVVSLPRFAPGAAPGPAAATGAQAASGTELACARRVLTSFNVTRVMKTGEMTLFAAGTYDDVFVEIDGCLLLQERTVVLDSRNLDTLLVIPI